MNSARIAAYGRAALAREVEALRGAAVGGRNAAAFKAAAGLGALVPSGALTYAEAESALTDAAESWGAAEAMKARGTIRRGLAEGMKSPRDLSALADRDGSRRVAPRPAPPPSPPLSFPPPSRPPLAEVEALWAAGLPVTSKGAEAVAALLRRRGLDAADVEDRDLARALPPAGPLPTWAAIGARTWRDSGHLALLPAFDATGALVTLRARAVRNDAEAKEVSAQGFEARGTVYADPLGRILLREGRAPDFLPVDRLRVVVAEGWPDFATWATRFSDADETAPATLGIYAGGWCREIADRIPSGATVAAWTDRDEAGDRYFSKLAETLGHRVRLRRSTRKVHHVAS